MAAVDLVGPLMVRLLGCATQALSPRPGRICLYPGSEVAYDQCCDDGQLWVRLISIEPRLGRTLGRGEMCMTGWTATLGVGVLRCAPTSADDGTPPTERSLDTATLQMTTDAAAIEQALRCCRENEDALTLSRWDPLGPEGMCVGGEWTVLAWVDVCHCEDVDG